MTIVTTGLDLSVTTKKKKNYTGVLQMMESK